MYLITVSFLFLHFICFVFIFTLCMGAEINTKVCSLVDNEECKQLARDGRLACHETSHRVDCALNIANGVTHLGILKAEEAFLAAPLISDNVVVIGEIKRRNQDPYQTVIVVKSDYEGGFDKLKSKKYCHPGFKNDPLISRLVLEELEHKVVNQKDACDLHMTLTERHIKLLANYFGPSCRPGLWSEDTELDKELKSKYGKLCELCGSAKCNVDYRSPMNDSLKCLLDNNADVALTTLKHIETLDKYHPGKYKSLCKEDGSVKDLKEACTWTDQLNDLIVARSEMSVDLQKLIRRYFPATNNKIPPEDEKYKTYLKKILGIEREDLIKYVDITSLYSHVIARREIPVVEDNKICNASMKWCTRGEREHEKCQWLRQASLNQGIQPVVECPHPDDLDLNTVVSCIDNVKHGEADIATINTNYAYAAAKQGLVSIAYPETDTRFVYDIQILLRADSTVKDVSELKGKSACLPEFGGKEMFAFASYISEHKLVKRDPDFGVVISDFLGESCLPGTKSFRETAIEDESKEKLCAHCVPVSNTKTAKYCNTDSFNKYYGNKGALQCLKDYQGDFAVITTSEIDSSIPLKAKVLCKNGSVIDVNSIKIDEACALSVIITSEVISRPDNPLNADYVLALRDFEELFGESPFKPFHLFDKFNGTKDLLFKDSTPGINFKATNVYIDNLKRLIASITGKSGTSKLISTLYLVLVPLFYVYIFK